MKRTCLLVVLSLLCLYAAFAQAGGPVRVGYETHHLDSKLMGRKMPYRVVLPGGYTGDTERYPAVYLLHGLTGHFDNWTDRTSLVDYAAAHKFVIVTPEGENGWYTDSLKNSNDRYESYIVRELIPEIDKKFRTIANRENRIVAGLSMGGYGAVKYGLKYPDMFSLVGSFSGALAAASLNEGNAGRSIGRAVDEIMGADDSATRKSNDIFLLIRDASPESVKKMPYVYQSCGTEDFLMPSNREFLALLNEKKVPHEYRELPGGHSWTFWNDQVREFLIVAQRRLGK